MRHNRQSIEPSNVPGTNNSVMMRKEAVFVLALCAITLSSGHYSLGFCRSHFTQGGYNRSVTLDELVSDGDYTVLYTPGLRQLEDVRCAHLGYVYSDSDQSYQHYSYVEAQGNKTLRAYEIHQLKSGSFHVVDKDDGYEDDTLQYIMYKKDNVMLIYWCNWIPTDDFDNNIWMIAARTEAVESSSTKEAVLEMLYHDEYRGLIDSDIEVFRHDQRKYLKLSPCQP